MGRGEEAGRVSGGPAAGGGRFSRGVDGRRTHRNSAVVIAMPIDSTKRRSSCCDSEPSCSVLIARKAWRTVAKRSATLFVKKVSAASAETTGVCMVGLSRSRGAKTEKWRKVAVRPDGRAKWGCDGVARSRETGA